MVSRYAITREVQHGFLRALPVVDLQVERELTLIWRHGVRLPAAVVAFLDLLRATGQHEPQAS
jgi:DNA-binding transcriptional LysR family regulator